MKSFLLISVLTVSAIAISSCDDENNPSPQIPPKDYANYSALKVGNYWIYQHFMLDSLGNSSSLPTIDSCYIEKDTVINTYTYFKLWGPDQITQTLAFGYVRDSLHYTVNSEGVILLSSEDFSTVFEDRYMILPNTDTVCRITAKMDDLNQAITVPAGTFNTINYKQTYDMFGNWAAAGDPRFRHRRYAENKGMINETLNFYSSQPTYTERRLIRYFVQ
jgi:hypothetical protein